MFDSPKHGLRNRGRAAGEPAALAASFGMCLALRLFRRFGIGSRRAANGRAAAAARGFLQPPVARPSPIWF